MEFLKGFKTVIFNVVMALVTIVLAFNPDLALDPDAVSAGIDSLFAAIAVLWAAGSVVLRWLTTTAIFKRE